MKQLTMTSAPLLAYLETTIDSAEHADVVEYDEAEMLLTVNGLEAFRLVGVSWGKGTKVTAVERETTDDD